MPENASEANTENADKTGEQAEPPKKKTKVDLDTSKRIGRCFESKDMSIGTGSTAKVDSKVDVHYYIELLHDGSITLEIVDEKGDPTGKILEEISIEDFAKRFKTCSQHDCSLQISTIDEIRKKMAQTRAALGEKHLENGELEKAEEKFKRALKFNEESVQANFGLGKTYLEQGKTEDAMGVFETLSNTEALFEKENKHVFNKFGIELRKLKMYDMAIANYERAIQIDAEDEALYFNLGRAYDKRGDIPKAIEKLKEALKLDDDFPEAKTYLKELIDKEQEMLKNLLDKKAGSA